MYHTVSTFGSLKQQRLIISVSLGQEFGWHSAGYLWLKVCHRLKSGHQLGLLSSRGSTGEDPFQAVSMTTDGSQFLIGCWAEPSTPGLGLHRAAHSWWLVSSGLKAPTESKR